MEDLMLAVLGYILIIGIAYAPQCPKAIKESMISQEITSPTTINRKKVGRKRYVIEGQLEIDFNALNSPSKLHDKTIRQLKKMASQAKIKYYGVMTKPELIEKLEAIYQ
jgi:hypothetical protein